MPNIVLTRSLVAGAAALVLLAVTPQVAWSVGDPPKPSAADCSQYKKGSPGWKRCMGQQNLDQDGYYEFGYWLAKTGQYTAALDALRAAPGQGDPRIQTMIGFSLRQLGHVDAARAYYTAALAANPGLTTTRQYLGEAFLQKNDPAGARQQLAEIAVRCGTGCADYMALADAIAAHARRG